MHVKPLACILLLLSLCSLQSMEPLSPPSGGVSLLPANLKPLISGYSSNFGKIQWAPSDHPDFKEALEVETRQRPDNPWDFQWALTLQQPVRKGDVIWVGIWIRTRQSHTETGAGLSQLVLEKNSTPYDKLLCLELSAGSEWQPCAGAFTAPRDYAAGEYQLCIRFGYNPQTIQIGGLQILNYQNRVSRASLQRTAIRYAGMEPDALWRKAAAERIERFRKSDLQIKVTNASGKPVSGATVEVHQLRHSFGFGSCVVANLITASGPDPDRYREVIEKSYSKVVIENDLKWPPWEEWGEGHRTKTLEALHWLQEKHIPVRGHNLVWPSWHNTPKNLQSLKGQPDSLRQRIDIHIRDIVDATRGLLSDWDVINEPFDNHDVMDILGQDVMTGWFKLARECNPTPVLFLNDYAGFMSAGENTAHKDHFEKTLRFLINSGAPIGGLGIQAHFGSQLTPPEKLLTELDRWAALGLDIQITEFDINLEDEELQAQYTRDFMTAVFSHPKVSALLTWGFWENSHWLPKAALYRKDWSLKPNGKAWNDLVLHEWHSDATLQTNPDGAAALRGFRGDYEITVRSGNRNKKVHATLDAKDLILSVVLD